MRLNTPKNPVALAKALENHAVDVEMVEAGSYTGLRGVVNYRALVGLPPRRKSTKPKRIPARRSTELTRMGARRRALAVGGVKPRVRMYLRGVWPCSASQSPFHIPKRVRAAIRAAAVKAGAGA